jgi:predicted TPR repeat methyltransferase
MAQGKSSKTNATVLLADGIARQQAGDLSGASKVYRAVLAADPGDADALHLLGIASCLGGNEAEALRCVRDALAIAPGIAILHVSLGNLLLRSGEPAAAIAAFETALAARPGHAEAQRQLGNAHRALGRLPEAEEALRCALALRPEHPPTLNDLAGVRASGGALTEAVELLQTAVRIDPTLAQARNNLGCALLQLQRCEEAIAVLREAVVMAPHYEPALRNLVAALWTAERSDEARAALAPQPPALAARCMTMLADLSCSIGAFDEAVAFADAAVGMEPGDGDLHLALGTALLGAGRSDDAIAAIRKAAELDRGPASETIAVPRPGTPAPRPLMTTGFEGSFAEQTFRAMQDGWADIFRALVAKNPRDEKLYLRFAHFKAVDGDRAAMLEIYSELLKVAPEHPVALHMVAALSGSGTTRRAPDAYVTHTFDGFADSFDENLKNLDYCGPELALSVIRRAGVAARMLDILDVGCGTGLCGLVLRPFARRLVGVDLSSGMLEKARARDIYDDLARAEITAYLRQLDRAYDMVVATDVLVYFGAIDEVVGGAAKALRKGGRFISTLEHLVAETEERRQFRLQQHGRYSHGEDSVRSTIAAAGFALETLEKANIRSERGVPVAGLVIAARKV